MLKLPIKSLFLFSLLCTTAPTKGQQPSAIAGLQLWLDAADVTAATGANPASGSTVATWKDKSGTGHNAVVLNGQSAAQFISNEINGNPVMRFTRNSQTSGCVYQVQGLDIRATTTPAVTIFTVYKQGTRSGDQGLWGDDNGDWDRFYFSSWSGYAGADNGGASLGPTNPAAIVIGAGVPDITRLLTAVYDYSVNNGSAIYFNGQVLTRFTDNTSATNAQSSFYIGFDGDDNCYNGDVAEVMVYNRRLTECEIQQVNKYLGQKYGSVFSTVAIAASGATTFRKGGNVLLNSATTGNTYQWLRDGVAISSATSGSYSATVSGSYRLAVNNGSCWDTSGAIMVTVVPPVVIAQLAPVVCNGDANGILKAAFAGGSSTYTVKWYKNNNNFTAGITTAVSGDTSFSQAASLGAGTYRAEVWNSNNILLTDTTYILANPAVLNITGNATAATCYNRCDGSATLVASGGVMPYQFILGAGAASSATVYTHVCANTYAIQVTDANGCKASSQIIVANPAVTGLALTANTDTLLCKGAALQVNAVVAGTATYLWSGVNGFTSGSSGISVSNAGLYKVTVTLADGCTYKDSIRLTYTSDTAVRARMMITAHAFINEEVVAVNLTSPDPQTQAWTIPSAAQITTNTSEKLVMKFPVKGTYEVKLGATSHNVCNTRDSATVLVDAVAPEVDNRQVLVREVSAAPNPTTGAFNLIIKLNQAGKVAVRIYSFTGILAYSAVIPGDSGTSITHPVNLSGATKGTYVIVVETVNSSEVRKILIN